MDLDLNQAVSDQLPIDNERCSAEKRLNQSIGNPICTDDKGSEYILNYVDDNLDDNFMQVQDVEGNKQTEITKEKGININVSRKLFLPVRAK